MTRSSKEDPSTDPKAGWCSVDVVYVSPRHAKATKTALTRLQLLHPSVRMTPADSTVGATSELVKCIAIPIIDDYSTTRLGFI